MPEPILIPSPDPLSLAIDAIEVVGTALEIAGIIPDPFAALLSLFAGKPRELSTLTVIQRLFGSKNPSGILWGVELYKLLKNQDIVLSDSTAAGQAAIGATRAQFKAAMTAQLENLTDRVGNPVYPVDPTTGTQPTLITRIEQIVNDIELFTTSATQLVPAELRVPWNDGQGNPTFGWCGNSAITAQYNANLAYAATVLGLVAEKAQQWALRKTLNDNNNATLQTLGVCAVMSSICQGGCTCASFGCEGDGAGGCCRTDGLCTCTQKCGTNGVLSPSTGQCVSLPPPPPPSCPGGEQLCTASCSGTSVPDSANPGCCTCNPVVVPPPIVCNPPQVSQNGTCVTPPPQPQPSCPTGEFPPPCGSVIIASFDSATGCCKPAPPPPPKPVCGSGQVPAPCPAGFQPNPQISTCCDPVPSPIANPCDSIATNLHTLVAALGSEGTLAAAIVTAIGSGDFGAVGTLLKSEAGNLFMEGLSVWDAALNLAACIGVTLSPQGLCVAPQMLPQGPNNTCPTGFTLTVETPNGVACCRPNPVPIPPSSGCPVDQYAAPCKAGDVQMSPTCCHTKIDPPHPYMVRRFEHPSQMLQFADF